MRTWSGPKWKRKSRGSRGRRRQVSKRRAKRMKIVKKMIRYGLSLRRMYPVDKFL